MKTMAKKVNITIGRFQPFTQGHLNMIKEGDLPCIVYRINSGKSDSDFTKIKVKGKVLKKESISNVVKYLDDPKSITLNETEKEVLKRPFTNELVERELEIIKKTNKQYFEDVVYVRNAYEAVADFNQRVSKGEYEPCYLMCGDDRVEAYNKLLSEEVFKTVDGQSTENVLMGKLTPNIGKGRTKGVSGTDVRNSIITRNQSKFNSIMPSGVSQMFDEFVGAFEEFKEHLKQSVKESSRLSYFIKESLSQQVNEGGAGGHMSHPYEYTDMTGDDLMDLVDNLFNGKIQHVKEKLDGANINATMNDNGEVVFIRNKSNLNDPKGGMSIKDMAEKWAEVPSVKQTFLTAGDIITRVFKELGKKYFNPDSSTRKVINCECIIAGKTNVMPYAEDRVAFHGYKLYKKVYDKWEEFEEVEGNVSDIYAAAKGISGTKPRPDLIITSIEDAIKFADKFKTEIERMFAIAGLETYNTLDEFKLARFEKLKPEWMDKEVDKIYARWFNGDKSFKATELKKLYPDHYEEIKSDKFAKPYIAKVMDPIDELFMNIGNEFINLVDGLTNSQTRDNVIKTLKKDIQDVVDEIEKNGTEDNRKLLQRHMARLSKIGENSLNAAEGVVFTYKGKLMKLTGSFAAINQILGITKFNR